MNTFHNSFFAFKCILKVKKQLKKCEISRLAVHFIYFIFPFPPLNNFFLKLYFTDTVVFHLYFLFL